MEEKPNKRKKIVPTKVVVQENFSFVRKVEEEKKKEENQSLSESVSAIELLRQSMEKERELMEEAEHQRLEWCENGEDQICSHDEGYITQPAFVCSLCVAGKKV